MPRTVAAVAAPITPRAIVAAIVKTWGMPIDGLQVRTIVRTTDRVPRLMSEPEAGNRHHAYTPEEATVILDGIVARSRYAGQSADKVLTALGVSVAARERGRADYARRTGKAPARKASASKPSAASKAPNRALGERAPRTPAAATVTPDA